MTLRLAYLAMCGLLLTACENNEAQVLECQRKGIAYFKEVGAWPRLRTTGEDAEKVALERCRNSLMAFGS
jgi:hypothetical protein